MCVLVVSVVLIVCKVCTSSTCCTCDLVLYLQSGLARAIVIAIVVFSCECSVVVMTEFRQFLRDQFAATSAQTSFVLHKASISHAVS